jgi:O-antigen ligase
MSLSRTFVIAYCINVTFLFFNSVFAKKFKYRQYGIFLIVIVVILIIMPNSFLNNIESQNVNRFLNARNNDISGGRIDILKDYANILYNNPQIMFFGVGKENYHKKLNVSNVAHNAIIGTIVTSGILGLLLIFLMFDFIFIKIKKLFQNKNIKFINYLPMLSLFFAYSTLDGLTSSLFTFGFFLSAICIHSKSNKKI